MYPKFDLSGAFSVRKAYEMRKCSRSEEFDLTGGRLIEVQLYIYTNSDKIYRVIQK